MREHMLPTNILRNTTLPQWKGPDRFLRLTFHALASPWQLLEPFLLLFLLTMQKRAWQNESCDLPLSAWNLEA